MNASSRFEPLPLLTVAQLLNSSVHNSRNPMVTGIAFSSAEVQPGDVFIAIPGVKLDGHCFLSDAQARGAAAAIISDPQAAPESLPCIVVDNTRQALSRLSAFVSGEPSNHLRVVAVTGTNGKTTVHWLTAKLLESLGKNCLRIGTLGAWLGERFLHETLTSPDPLTVHRSMQRARAAGATHVCMEASSHALDQHRLDDVALDIAVFTNLTRDHLDYHSTMERYLQAKLRLFEILDRSEKQHKTGIINVDDEFGRRTAALCRGKNFRLLTYGRTAEADIRIGNFAQDFSGSVFSLRTPAGDFQVQTQAIGAHNAENFAAVFAAALALGFPADEILSSLSILPLAPGRLEPVGTKNFGIYVDYAHTPDALENALRAVKALKHRKLWVVFGCGGDRDKGKRPMMADIARKLADEVIVTSDNPRTEDPAAIIRDILSSGIQPRLAEADRRTAIAEAVSLLEPGDILLIAGKGHEDYQILGTTKVHFSDQEEARNALEQRLAKF
jgi:UDP-N-acetylmuramoyl-L-alanyl-D-glutamate--2,6-diaminopimelate ligase